jgi:hypothetical protein
MKFLMICVLFADKSNLLLCQLEINQINMMTADSSVAGLLSAAPQCINVRNLQVIKSRNDLVSHISMSSKNIHVLNNIMYQRFGPSLAELVCAVWLLFQ